VLVASLTLLVVVGLRVLERDRDALFSRYGRDRELAMAEAARGVAGEVADIGEDLELASTLLQSAETTRLAERELHAIATIKREYLVMYARNDDGEITKVTAYDAPPGVALQADATLERELAIAASAPGTLHVSTAYASGGAAAWYRVFARRPAKHGPTVAVAVDTAVLLGRMKLQRDRMSRILVLDAAGLPAAVSDPALVPHAALFKTSHVVDSDVARSVGLPDAAAIAVSVPLVVDGGPSWTLITVASTQALEAQQRTLVRRVLVGGALVLVLLLSAAAYVLHNTFRARALRERVQHLSEMRRIEQRLLHSEKLVTAGQLAAGIAHEVGTPLNVARGRAELSLSHLGSSHGEADNQRIVIDQIDRVTRLIQQLLDYVRPTRAVAQLVDLAQALHVVADLLAPQAAKRKVTMHVDANATRLHTDPDQVQQIVVNLALNAIDACEAGGNVTLRALARDAAIVLEITDDGQGIAPELQKQVFDPFFTSKKRGQGTGLGLWVVAQLVRAQSAEIEVESTLGKGTTFRVTWPVAA
jgi:signal transduction histidine kinase